MPTLEQLEVLRAAINAAHMQNVTLDLSDNYRKLSNRNNTSALTRSLAGALEIVQDMIDAMTPEGDDEPVV